jgi:PTH1 family peptidyl-tRNA hydrolase
MPITLLVGLGNIGERYATTRHNAGFWLLDRLIAPDSTVFRYEAKFQGEVARFGTTWLLKPSTFMNRSGQSVIAFANFYKIPTENILVIHDELDFPPGTARLKQGGGDGKHNGLKSIIAHLNSPEFMRLRIGIGHPGPGHDIANYVLSSPTTAERVAIETILIIAIEIIPWLLAGEINKATQRLHTA